MRHLPPMTGWRDRLSERQEAARRQWRSFADHAGTDAPQDEFTDLQAAVVERRDLLRLFGASLALAGLAGCEARPDGRAMPYVEQPEGVVPGRTQSYATAIPFAGILQPVLGTTVSGRPIKLEGQPDHQASGGATDAFTQAQLLDLYDPDRSQAVQGGNGPSSWAELDAVLADCAANWDRTAGTGLRLLTGAITSPTLLRQFGAMQARWPAMRRHVFEPVSDAGMHAAAMLAFGRPLDAMPRLDLAQVVIAFDADPLGPGPRQVLHSLRWAARRRAFLAGQGRAALLVAEPAPTLTGARAGHRLAVSPSRIPALVEALARVFGLVASAPALDRAEQLWIEAVSRALAAAKGSGLVLVGGDQPPETRALGWAIDQRLGNLGVTSRFFEPLRPTPDKAHGLAALIGEMRAGRVSTLVVIDANPAYASPHGAEFATALASVPLSLHCGLWRDETGRACRWHAPLAHPLESWSDGRAADGSVLIAQPLIRPLYPVRSPIAMVAALMGDPRASDHAIVRQAWQDRWGMLDPRWKAALLGGIAEDPPTPATLSDIAPIEQPLRASPPTMVELVVRPDPAVWDGRLANNPWAQELPRPLSTLTWDNAVEIGPALAAARSLADGDLVRLTAGARSIEGPVRIAPGQAPSTVLIHLGQGRRCGSVASGVGFDAAPLADARFVLLEAIGGRHVLAAAQNHQVMDGSEPPVRTVDRIDPVRADAASEGFFPPLKPLDPSWAMSIDLDLCTGCGACVTACNAENNIPMVGREEVLRGRRMHWLRVDLYHEGEPADPLFHAQPVPCMHCEDAPCEMGCPVNAAVHSPEGLNLQVYNRCIGTRTCSSYCPYKVRRFNWRDYTGDASEPAKAQRNPNVTVRARGVMEKCTYCIQRISAARIDAKIAERPIADGAVKTACQQVCPTGAIRFGNIADPDADIVRAKRDSRSYALLEDRHTRPRTTYLARVREREGGDG